MVKRGKNEIWPPCNFYPPLFSSKFWGWLFKNTFFWHFSVSYFSCKVFVLSIPSSYVLWTCILYMLFYLACLAVDVTSTLYQKIAVPLETTNDMNTTTIITNDGVKQCGIYCSLNSQECNLFVFNKDGNSCRFGHVSILQMRIKSGKF